MFAHTYCTLWRRVVAVGTACFCISWRGDKHRDIELTMLTTRVEAAGDISGAYLKFSTASD